MFSYGEGNTSPYFCFVGDESRFEKYRVKYGAVNYGVKYGAGAKVGVVYTRQNMG